MYPFYPTDNPNKFGFITDNGISYVVEFSDASGYFDPACPIIEGVTFNPIGRKNGMDPKIAPTIAEIIKHRCRTRSTAVVYVCDQSGDRSRSKLFKGWNDMFNGGGFHFQPATIEHPQGKLYIGIIIDVQSVNAYTYMQEFSSAMQFISAKLN